LGQGTAIRAEGGEDRSVGSRWCEGYTLLDPLGQTLGRVERIFCNRAGEPQYVRVRAGLFGKRLVLMPVMDVAVDHGHRTTTLR
jgi:hypothetical protein